MRASFGEIQQNVQSDPDDPATWVAIRIDDGGNDGFVIGPFEETESGKEDSKQTLAEE